MMFVEDLRKIVGIVGCFFFCQGRLNVSAFFLGRLSVIFELVLWSMVVCG